ncbi:MAG: isoamylase early set domain-containing protein [Flavobacteriaceae bacterium]|nr:isoamylase early set domain-containing protein [Flavobacteriaceae bacterium]
MGIKKQFLKSKPICKVSFRVKAKDAVGAKSIQLLGNFNKWNESSIFMKELKSGDFTQTIELDQDKNYQFRYLVNGKIWTNDAQSDSKILNPFNEMNDVVSTFM